MFTLVQSTTDPSIYILHLQTAGPEGIPLKYINSKFLKRANIGST